MAEVDRNEGRLDFLDDLRTFIIFLVVLYHTGLVYESSGIPGSFWIVDDPSTNDVSGLVNLVLDIFMMPTLFFVAGYLTPASFARKGAVAFTLARARRLMLPWLLAVLTLIPLNKVIFLASRGLPQEAWSSYFHFSEGTLTSQNWLWFLPVLFAFSLSYALLSRLKLDVSRISFQLALLLAFMLCVVNSIAIDLLGANGWTKTVWIDFQNERLAIYFIAFWLGALAFSRAVFEAEPSDRLYRLASWTSWIPVTAYVVLLLNFILNPGSFILSELGDVIALRLAFNLSLFCLVYQLVEAFRRRRSRSGPLSRELSANSYAVYILHVVVVGAIAMALLDTGIPSIAKYLLVAVLAWAISNGVASAYRRATTILGAG